MNALPNGPHVPAVLQIFRWLRQPIAMLEACRRRYGDTFTLRFPGFDPLVLVSDPAAIKEISHHPRRDSARRFWPRRRRTDGGRDRSPYLDATIKETQRLMPIIPMVGRRLHTAMRIGGHELPAGVVVAPCAYLTHRRPDLWEEPDVFYPERFLGKRPSPYEFFPFGGGARACLGAAFASVEMKIVLSRILTRVEMRAAPG